MENEFFSNPENVKKLFQDVANLKAKKGEVEDELKKKEAIALAYMKQVESDKVETRYGNFFRIVRTTYSYSEDIAQQEKEVKERKKEEEASGIAQVKTSSASLRFVIAKGE